MKQQIMTESQIRGLKHAANKSVDRQAPDLIELSLKIHSNPELLFEEFEACKNLTGYLRQYGFAMEEGADGIKTAFKATVGGNRASDGPKVGIIAEYDALPGVGHGCGHNVIGAAAVGAGVAVASVIKDLNASIVVYGAPAEEGGNGKELMAKKGAFKELDAAMMIHPINKDMLPWDCPVIILASVEYFGKAGHPCFSHGSINALDAMFAGFNAYNSLRQRLLTDKDAEEFLVGGAILHGGDGAVLIPGYTKAQVILTAASDTVMKRLIEKVEDCFKVGAISTGASVKVSYDWDARYRELRSNRVMCGLFDANMRKIRRNWNPTPPSNIIEKAATDMGSVSQIVPSIHVGVAIAPASVPWHSGESTAAAGSDEGHSAVLDGAKAMAMTAIDLFCREDMLEKSKREFAQTWKIT